MRIPLENIKGIPIAIFAGKKDSAAPKFFSVQIILKTEKFARRLNGYRCVSPPSKYFLI